MMIGLSETVNAMHGAINAIHTHDPDALAIDSDEEDSDPKGILYNGTSLVTMKAARVASKARIIVKRRTFTSRDRRGMVNHVVALVTTSLERVRGISRPILYQMIDASIVVVSIAAWLPAQSPRTKPK